MDYTDRINKIIENGKRRRAEIDRRAAKELRQNRRDYWVAVRELRDSMPAWVRV